MEYKEFQGKTLDEAISEACSYYNVAREKLEVEIINDVKNGIFGLVGAKKATVRARKAVPLLTEDIDDELFSRSEGKKKDDESFSRSEGKKKADTKQHEVTAQKTKTPRSTHKNGNNAIAEASVKTSSMALEHDADFEDKKIQEREFFDLSEKKEEVEQATRETLSLLLSQIVDELICDINIQDNQIYITLDCGDHANLVVGREGQTLYAIQYLAVRILAKQLGGPVRLHIDVGNYREMVDQRLRELALSLGEKARKTGRVQSTRPLSAYHRRLIHLTLEAENDLYTHSKGEGAQKRVIIQRRRRSPRVKEETLQEESYTSSEA